MIFVTLTSSWSKELYALSANWNKYGMSLKTAPLTCYMLSFSVPVPPVKAESGSVTHRLSWVQLKRLPEYRIEESLQHTVGQFSRKR